MSIPNPPGLVRARVLVPVAVLVAAGAVGAWSVLSGPDADDHAAPIESVSVHFAEKAGSDTDFAHTVAVQRRGGGHDASTFALEQLAAGPTADERARGLYSPLQDSLTGASDCGGRDFTLRIEAGRAEVRFCRTVTSGGIGDDGRIGAGVGATLRQFADVERVVLLDRDGSCFGDESGEDACLKS